MLGGVLTDVSEKLVDSTLRVIRMIKEAANSSETSDVYILHDETYQKTAIFVLNSPITSKYNHKKQ
jgi:hypothetical protein